MSEEQRYTYLTDLPEDEGAEDLVVPADFVQVAMGHTNIKIIDGVTAERSKFSAEGFPKQNLDQFYFIPLYINPNKRMMYLGEYDGGANPPDCQSNDGMRPTQPLVYQGQQITACGNCPLYGYGRDFNCHDKPTLIMMAYFPDHNDLLVPVRKDIPTKSIKALHTLARQLTIPADLGSGPQKLPYWARIVRAHIAIIPSSYGPMASWGFKLLSAEDDESSRGMPYNFVPEHILAEITPFLGFARKAARADAGSPQLTGQAPMPALPSGESRQTGNVQPSAMVLEKEAQAYY